MPRKKQNTRPKQDIAFDVKNEELRAAIMGEGISREVYASQPFNLAAP